MKISIIKSFCSVRYGLAITNIRKINNYLGTKTKTSIRLLKIRIEELIRYCKPKIIRAGQFGEYWTKKQIYTFPKYASHRYQTFAKKYGSYVTFVVYFATLTVFIGILGKEYDLRLLNDTATTLFISAAAMIGASIAIVATFGQFTIQYAAEKLPKNFYNIAINIKTYFFIFWLLCLVTFVLFLEGLLYGKLQLGLSEISIQIGFILIGASFYLIYRLFISVINDVNPNNILKRVQRNIETTTKAIYNRTRGYAEVMLLHPDNRGEYDLKQALTRLFQDNTVKSQLNYFVSNADFLFDYHDQMFHSFQTSTALEVLHIIESLVLNYIDIRKDSSIASPNPEALMVFTSDSEYVLQPILERMRGLCDLYMIPNNAAGIQQIISVFQNWTTKASEVNYLGLSVSENPILEQISGYFNFTVENAKKTESLEYMFQSGYFYRHILGISIDKNFIHIFSANLNNLEKLGLRGLALVQDGVIKQTFDVYDYALRKVIDRNSHLQDVLFKLIIESVEKVALLVCKVRNTKAFSDSYVIQQYVVKPLNTLKEYISIYAREATQETSDTQREEFIEKLLWLQDEFQTVLRGVARNLNDPNHFIITSLGPDIRDVGFILLNLSESPLFTDHKDKFISEARLYAVLPEFFIDQGKNVSNEQEIDYIVDAISRIGLKGLAIDANQVGESAISSLSRMAFNILNNSGTMYVECEVMKHVCYLGILAKKKNLDEILTKLKTSILDFMDKYKNTHYSNIPDGIDPNEISPPPDKLKRDIEQLAESRRVWHGREFLGVWETREDLFELITTEDIENFIIYIWGS